MNLSTDKAKVPRKSKSLTLHLVEKMSTQIRSGQLKAGDKLPTEAAIMQTHGVSRTVVREAISRMQASKLLETRHGIGTFVLPQDSAPSFSISSHQLSTLREVIALLEFRISIETEAAALAAQRRNSDNLKELHLAMSAFSKALADGRDAVQA
ncbi:MAG: FadR family transcriptional regulator, partial [Betaproteobacteria bacterium]|nr:FadR family transcriptional regulator [Betaproteobacteria bacterium]